MRVQLWSYNYDPEPQGIAPLTKELARQLQARGHEALVVAAHPHYPEPKWGTKFRPYRERRDNVPVLRLPLWIGRESGAQRIRQELTFATAQAVISPLLPGCDVVISVTPCLPALAPAMVFSRLRRVPWVIWLQDMVADGAESTGLVSGGPIVDGARGFESMALRSASRVVVISEAFRAKLQARGVPGHKIVRIFNPSTRNSDMPVRQDRQKRPRVLAMGNIGHSQGLDRIVRAFEQSAALNELDAELVIAGHGVAAESVQRQTYGSNVRFTGVLYGDELEPELQSASIGLVSQRPDIHEFNLPSKLMTYMAYGLPVIASVQPTSETARIVIESGCGWVTDAQRPDDFAEAAATRLKDIQALRLAGEASFRYGTENFSPEVVAGQFEKVLVDAVMQRQLRSQQSPSPQFVPRR